MSLIRTKNWLRKIIFPTGFIFLFTALSGILSNLWIVYGSRDHMYTSVNTIPENNVGLVLGVNKKTSRGYTNLYFKYRMEAAALLYKEGKIKHILVSGDNHSKHYDESTDMKEYLMQLGVPEAAITLDYAGFRTLDSVIRAKKVFGQSKITIISQQFHNERALFLAEANGLEAVAFNARDVPSKYDRVTKVREFLAKFKAVIDTYLLFESPKFLGKPVKINVS